MAGPVEEWKTGSRMFPARTPGDDAKWKGIPPVGLEAETLSAEERRTLESLAGIVAKEKFLKSLRRTRKA